MVKPQRKLRPPRAAASIEQALVLHRDGQLSEAEKIYGAILRIDPGHFDALHLYGVLQHQQGRSLEALRLVGRALRANSSSAEAFSNHRRDSRSPAAARGGACELRVPPLSIRANDVSALYNRGNALKALRRYDEALASYCEVLSRQPSHIDAQFNRGNTFSALGRQEEALASFDAVLALRPSHIDALIQRGNSLRALARHSGFACRV